MTTSRQAYRIDPSNPGSDLAGETAAAMAAASMVFRRSNPGYANTLLSHAYQVKSCAMIFTKMRMLADKWYGVHVSKTVEVNEAVRIV